MPKASPPAAPVGRLHRHTLPALSRLERIHSSSFGGVQFNPTVPQPGRGGRFDTIDGDYSFLYAGEGVATAVEEVLLRDIPQVVGQARQLPRAQLENRKLSDLSTACDLPLVDLRTRGGLGAVGQDQWLVRCGSAEYPCTREWARAIRSWDDEAAGFVWKSRCETGTDAYVFFGDRLEADALLSHGDGLEIGRGAGRALIDAGLRAASAVVV